MPLTRSRALRSSAYMWKSKEHASGVEPHLLATVCCNVLRVSAPRCQSEAAQAQVDAWRRRRLPAPTPCLHQRHDGLNKASRVGKEHSSCTASAAALWQGRRTLCAEFRLHRDGGMRMGSVLHASPLALSCKAGALLRNHAHPLLLSLGQTVRRQPRSNPAPASSIRCISALSVHCVALDDQPLRQASRKLAGKHTLDTHTAAYDTMSCKRS